MIDKLIALKEEIKSSIVGNRPLNLPYVKPPVFFPVHDTEKSQRVWLKYIVDRLLASTTTQERRNFFFENCDKTVLTEEDEYESYTPSDTTPVKVVDDLIYHYVRQYFVESVISTITKFLSSTP